MLKKLRREFILIAMLAFCAVILLIIAGINLMNGVQVRNTERETLENLLEYDRMAGERTDEDVTPVYEMPWAEAESREFTTRFFIVHCSRDGEVGIFGNEYIYSVDEETAGEYTRYVLEKRQKTGVYENYRYCVEERGEELVLVFLNIENDVHFRHTLLIISLVIGSVSIVLVLFLILLLSGFALRPYERNEKWQRQFITDAGHELKTPIASIITSADILAEETEDNEWVENIRKQTTRLGRLVNDLITLSRMNEVEPQLEKETFSLTDAVWEMTDLFIVRAKAKQLRFDREIAEKVEFTGDRDALQKMLSILLENAVRYTPEQGGIRLELKQTRGRTTLILQNTCEWPEHLELDRMFDRFYRPDDARSAGNGGTGIGLAIAKAIVEAHGGTICAERAGETEIRFRILL